MKTTLLVLLAACRGGSSNPLDAGADAPRSSGHVGEVNLSQGLTGGDVRLSAFVRFGDYRMGPTLAETTECTAYELTTAGRSLSAGAIAVRGTTRPLTITPAGQSPTVDYEPQDALPDPIFAPGALLHFDAMGGADIPAFSATLRAPLELTGFTPPSYASRAGFAVTWNATASDAQLWVMIATLASTTPTELVCTVPDTGSFAVPADALALLPDESSVYVGVARVATTTVHAGDTKVAVEAAHVILSSSIAFGP